MNIYRQYDKEAKFKKNNSSTGISIFLISDLNSNRLLLVVNYQLLNLIILIDYN